MQRGLRVWGITDWNREMSDVASETDSRIDCNHGKVDHALPLLTY
jgi:hypothetical protein